jgi:hypothetical protein
VVYLTRGQQGWRRWLPIVGAALLGAALAVGVFTLAMVSAFFGGSSKTRRRR